MRAELNIFLAGMMFYTRLPVPSGFHYHESYLPQANKYLPLIGIIVGAAGALVYGLATLVFPASVAVLLSMVATVLLTGAFHEDGFADVCDGFGGGWGRDAILRIMKDSRIGSYGVVGIALLMGTKWCALLELHEQGGDVVIASLIAGHAISRFMALTVMQRYDYVQLADVSKAQSAANHRLTLNGMRVALLLALLPLTLFLGEPVLLLALLPVWLSRCYLAWQFQSHIGGYTGDCLGSVQQVCEVMFYLSVLALCGFT